jgi:methyl-accepting chemotaxis protein
MGLLTLIAFGLAGALGVWLSGTLTRPITHLRDVAERVSQGDFEDVEISVETQDEVGDLARAFRRMVASLRILMPQGSDEGELGIGRL